MNIGGAAVNQTPVDWENNKQNIIHAIEMARIESCELLCLPELSVTGYGCEDLFLSDWLYENALQKLLEIKAYCYDITVVIGLPVKYREKRYNCACIISDTKIMGFVPKQFLANDGIHYEHRWFTPWPCNELKTITINGTAYPFGDKIFNIGGKKTGVEICEDAWRSETRPAWRHAEKEVDIILNLSASHFAFGKTRKRDALVQSSSDKFDCVYVFSNLLGNESGRVIFDGEILIGQAGNILAKNDLLSFRNFNMQIASIDFDKPEQSTAKSPYYELSREEEFLRAETLGLFDYMRKSGTRGYVISLSGGADSSTCTLLVGEMVRRGIEELTGNYFLKRAGLHKSIPVTENDTDFVRKVTGYILCNVYQGSENSSEHTYKSAYALSNDIGATFYSWNIDDVVKNYTSKVESVLKRKLDWEKDDLTLQNIQARARSPVIWMLANIKNALLIATPNRSEGDVGYTTMDGDTSGSIAPIAGVDKAFIRKWLKWAEEALNYESLNYVNSLQPTAELRPKDASQSDEDDLMPYDILVRIERLGIKEKQSPLQMFEKLKNENITSEERLKEYIRRFFGLWSKNQWKRERTAPAFHLDDFNIDPKTWCRFPILSGSYIEELKQLQ